MPLYDYLCPTCGKMTEAYRTVANRNRGPKCCGKQSKKQISSHHLAPMFTEYKAVGHERGRRIKNRQEHKDYLKRWNYDEVGDDASMAPPPDDPDRDAQQARETAEAMEQLKHAPDI